MHLDQQHDEAFALAQLIDAIQDEDEIRDLEIEIEALEIERKRVWALSDVPKLDFAIGQKHKQLKKLIDAL